MTLYLTDNTSAEEIARACDRCQYLRDQILSGWSHDQFRLRRYAIREMLPAAGDNGGARFTTFAAWRSD